MKKIISLLLVTVMVFSLTGVLAGCNKAGKPTVAPSIEDNPEALATFDTTKPVTIVFYHSMGANLQGVLNDAIADFNKVYPNITIEHKTYGDYDGVRDQIKTEISVGDQPNLAYCYPDHVALYNVAGAVQSLDALINNTATITRPYYQSEIDMLTYQNSISENPMSEADLQAKIAAGITEPLGFTTEQIADFIPAYYNEGKAYGDGKMYTLPVSKSTEVLYYNKSFFESKGLKVPTTWEEMEAVCRQIKAIDPNCIPLGYDSESNWFITMCEQYGSEYTSIEGENFRFDNETNRAFVKKFQSWYAEGLVTTQELFGGYTSDLFKGAEKANGSRCYMCIGSTGGATYQQPNQTNGVFDFEVGIASIPQVNPAEPKVISQGPSICIFKKGDAHEVMATWLFAKFLATDINFQAAVSMTNGYAPVISSVTEHPAYAQFLSNYSTANIQAYAVKVALEQADAYYVSPAFNGSSVARDQVGILMQACMLLTGNDIDEAIKKAFEQAIYECKYQSGQ